MEEKKIVRRITTKKATPPKVDERLLAIKEVERKLNSLEFGERIKFSGALKNGKLDLSKLK